eukprot:7370690-Ditylum_brightwellii.AAC.1
MEEFDFGKTSKAMGKEQSLVFEQAFQMATVEYNKPIELRLEWSIEYMMLSTKPKACNSITLSSLKGTP